MEYQAKENLTLTEILTRLAPGSSKSAQRNWVKVGRVTVDQRVVQRFDYRVEAQQIVRLASKSKPIYQNVTILYEDRDLVVVDKPKGLLSVSTNFEVQKTVHAVLKEYYAPRRVFVIHRLDQDTSGVMLFGLSEAAYTDLKADFKSHAIKRLYVAIVEGHFKEREGKWSSYLWEDANYLMHSTQDPSQGEKAITHFKVVATSRRFSWIELLLETGKKNQIRIHCQEASHPIVGDAKYGSSMPVKRVYLHAHLLAFNHPITKKWSCFTSPVPDSFFKLVNPKGSVA